MNTTSVYEYRHKTCRNINYYKYCDNTPLDIVVEINSLNGETYLANIYGGRSKKYKSALFKIICLLG